MSTTSNIQSSPTFANMSFRFNSATWNLVEQMVNSSPTLREQIAKHDAAINNGTARPLVILTDTVKRLHLGLQRSTVWYITDESWHWLFGYGRKQSNTPQAAALTYRALVQLEQQSLSALGGSSTLALNAGMAATAEIHQGKRSVLEYLLSPVMKVSSEAARER